MDLMELVAKLSLDTSDYTEKLKGAAEKAQSFAGKFAGGLKTAGVVAAGAVTAVGAAAGVVGKAFTDSAGDLAAYGDNIDKMSQKLGISAEAYQEWDAVLQHSGTSIEAMKPAFKTLQKSIDENSEAFKALGISEKEVQSLSTEELFSKVVTGLQGMEEGAERTALATDLLGKAAMDLGPLLNTSAEDTEAMKKRVHELNGVMSNEAVKAAAAYQDSLQDMQTAFTGLKRNLMSEFLPSMVNVMDGITNIFSGDSAKGLKQVEEGINTFVKKLTDSIPKVMDTATRIMQSLAKAIVQNLPAIFEAGANALTQLLAGLTSNTSELAQSVKAIFKALVGAITTNLPTIVNSSVDIIIALADGLIDAIPDMIPAVVEVILAITEKLTDPDTVVKLIDASFQIMGAIGEGLIKAIPVLIQRVPAIISALVTAVLKGVPQILKSGMQLIASLAQGMINALSKPIEAVKRVFTTIKQAFTQKIKEAANWGRDLIQNFVNGIKSKFNSIRNAMSSVGSLIRSFIHFSEPDVGPLADFSTYAPDMMKQFAKGIKDNEDILRRQVAESFDLRDSINLNPVANSMPGNMRMPFAVPMNEISQQQPRELTVILELDRTELGKAVYKLNNEETQRHGVKLVTA